KLRYAVLQLPKVAPERGRFAADRYLFQVDHKAYSQDAINCSIRTLLFKVVLNQGQAVDFSSHALRHAFATELRKLGVDYDIIQQLLHQRDVRTTMYYSQPTKTMVRKSAELIFVDRIDVDG